MNLFYNIFNYYESTACFPATSLAGMIKPFYNPASFIALGFFLFIATYVFTSLAYFLFRWILVKSDEEDDHSGLHWTIILMGISAGVISFYFLRSSLHSLTVDSTGDFYRLFTPRDNLFLIFSDILLATAIMGVTANWLRIFQILLINDISERFRKLINVLPYLSSFMTLGLLTVLWFFYSNYFGMIYYFFIFCLIYGAIIYFSNQDFLKRLQMRISRSAEFEENLSKKNIFLFAGILMVIIIVIIYVLMHAFPLAYGGVLLLLPFLIATYLTPGKLFRYLKPYPRFTTAAARILYFTRFTRKFLLFWVTIGLILSVVLSFDIFVEPGFKNPYKNFTQCAYNVKQLGETMEQYMEQNSNYLPDSFSWKDDSWISKIKEDRKLTYIPSCPSSGVHYEYKKWRGADGKPLYEIRCSCGAHRRAHIDGFYPRYLRKKGLIEKAQNSSMNYIKQPKNQNQKKGG